MGSVCSRCRRDSTSSITTDDECNNHQTVQSISQRPQSSFSLHNIDTLANNGYNEEFDEREKGGSEKGSVDSENLEQRTSIENENASIENVTSEDSNISPPMVKRKSSFSDLSSTAKTSTCSTPSSNKSYDHIETDINQSPSKKISDKESSSESFVMESRISVSSNIWSRYLTTYNSFNSFKTNLKILPIFFVYYISIE